MAMPMFTTQSHFDSGAFPFVNLAPERHKERLDVCECDGSGGGTDKDGAKDFSVLCIHSNMLAKNAI